MSERKCGDPGISCVANRQGRCIWCRRPAADWCDTCKGYRFSRGNCGRDDCRRPVLKTHKDRADTLRSEVLRLASWSRTPDEVANALIEAVRGDNAILDEMGEGK